MFQFLKKLFIRKKRPKMKKFDAVIIEKDANGQPRQRTVMGEVAPNRDVFIGIHASCDERVVEIIREYDDQETKELDIKNAIGAKGGNSYSKQELQKMKEDMENLHNAQRTANGVDGIDSVANISTSGMDEMIKDAKDETEIKRANVQEFQSAWQAGQQRVQKVVVRTPPRYFKIGSVECKEDNGKIYQKQWMRVNDENEYRIVSDATNKITPLKGKHIEHLMWVLIEDENQPDEKGDSERTLING